MSLIFRTVLTVGTLSCLGFTPAAGQSVQTLQEMLARAYETSPALGAARAGQRATDETLPQAQSNLFRPSITLNAQEGRTRIRQEETDTAALGTQNTKVRSTTTDRKYGYTLNLPLFRGGQTLAAIDEAESAIAAGQANLIATEISVLSETVNAYADVVYYRMLSELGQDTVSNYRQRVDRTREELEAQRRTVSDLALFRSSLASSRNSRATTEGERRAAEATFQALTGELPAKLERWPSLKDVPASLEAAREPRAGRGGPLPCHRLCPMPRGEPRVRGRSSRRLHRSSPA